MFGDNNIFTSDALHCSFNSRMSPLQFATRDFLQSGILTMIDTGESVKPPFKKRNSKCCSSEAYQASNVQAISKGSDHPGKPHV